MLSAAMNKTYASVLMLMLVCCVVRASEHHAPLPSKILEAKTVYIDNQTGYEEAADHCYDALQRWGRYTVVQDKSKADLILVLAGNHETRGAYANGSAVVALRRSLTSLSVVDPATGDVLWSDTESAPHGSRAGSLVDKFRRRVEGR
jgi:hypothetical protein